MITSSEFIRWGALFFCLSLAGLFLSQPSIALEYFVPGCGEDSWKMSVATLLIAILYLWVGTTQRIVEKHQREGD